jgi:tRNA(Ile)-lysidine synthetase-like protein
MPAPRGLLQQLDQHLHRCDLLPPGQWVLVACSGGADSVALLRLLHALNQSNHWHWTLAVGHVNHNVRGAAARADARFVRDLARQLGLPYHERRLTWPAGRTKGRISEAELRSRRQRALTALAHPTRSIIALAHHADDQAETVLMRILRGTGIHGLAGIPERQELAARSRLAVPDEVAPARLRNLGGGVRPLLGVSRTALREYLHAIGQPWREDASNTSHDYLRNRIRHELLPLLETYQPAIRTSLTRLAQQAGRADHAVEQIRQAWLAAGLQQGWITITSRRITADRRFWEMPCTRDRSYLPRIPDVIVGRQIQLWLEQLGCGIDAAHASGVERVLDGVENWRTGVRVTFSAGVSARFERQGVVFAKVPVRPRKATVRSRSSSAGRGKRGGR